MMDEDGRDSEAVVVARQLPRSYQTDSKTWIQLFDFIIIINNIITMITIN